MRKYCTKLKRQSVKAYFCSKCSNPKDFCKIVNPFLSNPFLSNKGQTTPYIVLCEGEWFITESQHVAGVMNHGFTPVADHIGDANPMVKNGDITVQDIVKHYENHPSIFKIKEFLQSMPRIDPFKYTHTSVENTLEHIDFC